MKQDIIFAAWPQRRSHPCHHSINSSPGSIPISLQIDDLRLGSYEDPRTFSDEDISVNPTMSEKKIVTQS